MANLTLRSIDASPITLWLQRWADGDEAAAAALAEAMLPLLRRVAVRMLGSAQAPDDITPTVLLHDVWLRLAPSARRRFDNRRHFFGSAVRAMHYVMIERHRQAVRTPPGELALHAPEVVDPADVRRLDVMRALERLHDTYPRQGEALLLARVMGLTLDEIAETLDVSVATARRDIAFAEAFVKQAAGVIGDDG